MILQGERMDARIGDDPTKLLPVASLNFVKMAVITLLIPVLDRVVFPLMDSVDRKPTLLQRIGQWLIIEYLRVDQFCTVVLFLCRKNESGKSVRFYRAMYYSAKRGLAIACRLSVCPSVCLSMMLVDYDHIGWKSWKLTAQAISPTSSLFVAQRPSTYSHENMEKFWGENVRSTPTSIASGWIESTESHVILGGGVTVCLLLSANRAVIFAIARLSCWMYTCNALCICYRIMLSFILLNTDVGEPGTLSVASFLSKSVVGWGNDDVQWYVIFSCFVPTLWVGPGWIHLISTLTLLFDNLCRILWFGRPDKNCGNSQRKSERNTRSYCMRRMFRLNPLMHKVAKMVT